MAGLARLMAAATRLATSAGGAGNRTSAQIAEFPFLEFQYGESPLFFDIVEGALPDPRQGSSVVPRVTGLGIGIDMTKLTPLLI